MAVTLTLAVLAAVSLESVREGLQNAFAWACTVVADNMWAAATVTLLLAAMCALLAMLLRPAPLGPIVSVTSKRGPKWQYFVYGNVVAAIVFPVSLAWLATILADSGFSVNSMSLLTRHSRFLVAATVATSSFAYLLLFLGVGAMVPVARAVSDGSMGVTPSQQASGSGKASDKASIAESPDVIVVGAGTTGGALAASLGRRGYRVLLLEKTMVQADRIVGELLQPGGLRVLERLGLSECATAGIDSVPVRGYSVFKTDGTELPLSYPARDPRDTMSFLGMSQFNPVTAEHTAGSDAQPAVDGSLPPPVLPTDGRPLGRSFHNTRFVDNLRKAAAAEPTVLLQEGTARKLVTEVTKGSAGKERITGVVWTDAEGVQHTTHAPLTVVADGIWSNFRKRMTESKPSTVSYFVGYVLNHPAHASPLPRRYFGHVILCDPTPVLLYQISSTETRILVDTGNKLPSVADGSMSKFMLEHTLPQLPAALQPYFEEAVRTQQPKSMPNRALAATADPVHVGGILLGDSFNMRHPLTGSGMTVCLKDVELFLRALEVHAPGGPAQLRDLAAVSAAVRAFQHDRASHAATINVLAHALYRVFSKPSNDDGTRQQFRDACFDYLTMGGTRTAGPVSLLSALTPYPWVLAAHFFLVAAHAMRGALLPVPTPSKLRRAYRILHVACIIIMPQLEEEGVTFLSTWPLRFVTNLIFPWRGVTMAQ